MPRIIHFEIPADDPQRAVDFYTKTFGWTFSKWDGPFDYWLVKTGPDEEPGIDGGLGARRNPDEGPANTIGVESVDTYAEKIEENGGTITMPKAPIPGVGWLAQCRDTEGNVFSIMQPDPEAK